MNKKVINGLIVLTIGLMLIVLGGYFVTSYFGTGMLYANSFLGNYYYFFAAFAVIGAILSIIGWCKINKNYVPAKKKKGAKKLSLPKITKPVSKLEQKPAAPVAAATANIPVSKPAQSAPAGMTTVSYSFCGKCGKKNKAGSKFCAGCGEAL